MTRSTTVTLGSELEIDGQKTAKIVLREPRAGELRGIGVTDVLQMNVAAMMKLLPRITTPAMTSDHVADLYPADYMLLAEEVVLFFTPAGRRAEMLAAKETALERAT